MRKRRFAYPTILALSLFSALTITEYDANAANNYIKTTAQTVAVSNTESKITMDTNEAKRLFRTKYRVCVSKATMRSGPGTNYSSLGILYKNDVIWVQSISNGWAKFKVNSMWHYISTSCIEKATY